MLELALDGVVVELDAAIIDEQGKPRPSFFDLSDRLSDIPFFEILRFQLPQPRLDVF